MALWTPQHLGSPPTIRLNDEGAVTDAGGGACSQWNDASGLDNHFAQSTPGFRPTILSAELNGRRVIRFDGSDDRLVSSETSALGVFQDAGYGWALLVYKKRTTDGGATARAIFSTHIGSAASARFMVQAGGPTGNAPSLTVRRVDGDSSAVLDSAVDTSTEWVIALARMDWANGDGFLDLDGANVASNLSLTSSGNTSNTPSLYSLAIGAFPTDAGGATSFNFADIDVAEIVVGSGDALSADDIDRLFGYAAHWWGLTDNLPGGHPYKVAAPLQPVIAPSGVTSGEGVGTPTFAGTVPAGTLSGSAAVISSLAEIATFSESLTGAATADASIADGLRYIERLSASAVADFGAVAVLTFSERLSAVAVALGSLTLAAPTVTVWVVNAETGASTRYENYDFNSFAKIGDSYYGCRADGIHKLDGDTDGGDPIQAMVSFGKQDFGTTMLKRVTSIYLGASTTGKLFVKVLAEGEEYLYSARDNSEEIQLQRVDIGRGLRANYFEFELYNADGDDFELASVEFAAVPLSRRI